MKKLVSLILVALIVMSMLPAAVAAATTDKDTVKRVQQALNDAGYDCGTPDGIAGKKTFAAIDQYCADEGMEPTGTIDDALLEALGLEAAVEAQQPEAQADAGRGVIPDEVVALTGGAPDTIWALADRYDLEALVNLYSNWDSLAMLEGLLTEGSYTFDPMGMEWASGDLHVRDADHEGPYYSLTLTPSEEGVTAELREPLSVDNSCKYLQLEFFTRSDERGGKYCLRANYYYDSMEPGWCGAKYTLRYQSGTDYEYQVERSNLRPYSVRVELPSGGEIACWRATYDEAGSLTDFTRAY